MNEPIPYATEHRPSLTARELFGVVVRTIGLLLILWGLYCALYFLSVRFFGLPTSKDPVAYIVFSALYFLFGAALLKGEWIVQIAYGNKH